MAFKGIRNEAGRPKGTPNKNTADIRAKFQLLVEDNIDTLSEDIKALKPLERLKIIIDLAKFVVPTLKATELTTDPQNGFNPITINLGNGICLE